MAIAFQNGLSRHPNLSLFRLDHIRTDLKQRIPLFCRHLEFLDRSPFITASIYDTISGDGDIFCIFRCDGRHGTDAVLPFITGNAQGIILFCFDEFKHSLTVQVQINAT